MAPFSLNPQHSSTQPLSSPLIPFIENTTIFFKPTIRELILDGRFNWGDNLL